MAGFWAQMKQAFVEGAKEGTTACPARIAARERKLYDFCAKAPQVIQKRTGSVPPAVDANARTCIQAAGRAGDAARYGRCKEAKDAFREAQKAGLVVARALKAAGGRPPR